MSIDAISAVSKLVAAFNEQNWIAFAELLHRDAVFEAPGPGSSVERFESVDAILEYLKKWFKVIPDAKATITKSVLGNGGRVDCDVVYSGTHTGMPFEWADITVPATGDSVTFKGSTEYVVKDGEIFRITDQGSPADLLAGFGVEST